MKQQLATDRATLAIKDSRSARRSVKGDNLPWRRRVGLPYLFLAPFLLIFLIFFILPLGYSLWISLFADKLIGGTVFVGIANYIQVVQDGEFWQGVLHVVLFLVIQVPIMIILALFFALVLDSGSTYLKGLFRIGFFIPYAIPSVIAALLWGYLYSNHFGPLVQIASFFNLPAPNFLSPTGILPSLINISTWQWTGYNMIVLYAALHAIPQELYEAAHLDGANWWHTAIAIKIPIIAPAIVLTVIFSIIGSLQLFNEPQILYTIVPNVIQDHYTPNLYAYTLAFTNQQYNYSAAVSFALGAIVFVFSYVFMLFTNKDGEN
ncbi:carbohydrate ABC transporter permease [Dictyobacter arantiisoli]|uniref:Sugar ABC transporter permease n=1 Tax=Dictyobacter arantiisoli TaxID=2014874 RepID=A0A5A5THX0_9CHLR|nr:sugar ABC transporter permease [Dictyobacter arantiisoli]GCF10564.1 sugar ABC transporter permease [Dictyobacter arantiisoli]